MNWQSVRNWCGAMMLLGFFSCSASMVDTAGGHTRRPWLIYAGMPMFIVGMLGYMVGGSRQRLNRKIKQQHTLEKIEENTRPVPPRHPPS